MKYSGFFRRVAAYLVDTFILGVPVGIIASSLNLETSAEIYGSVELNIITIIIAWTYFTFSESSEWQATIGKKLLHIYVTDLEGKRLTVSRAFFRQITKIVTNFTLGIGFLLIFFTPKKQAIHDILAGTLVLREK